MTKLDDLIDDRDEWRALISVKNEALEDVLKQLWPYFAAKREFMDQMQDTLCGTGFRGPAVTVPSCRWIGSADQGHAEPCERRVIQVEGTAERLALRADFYRTYDEYRPLLHQQRELRADLDAAIREMNAVQKLIKKQQDDTAKRKQYSFAEMLE